MLSGMRVELQKQIKQARDVRIVSLRNIFSVDKRFRDEEHSE